jgi:hypothetical protein
MLKIIQKIANQKNKFMKKLLITIFAITLASGVFAQDTTNNMNKMDEHPGMQKKEGVMMKKGKLILMKGGLTSPLTTDLTLDNGAVVMANGTVKMSDGSIKTLQDGDYVQMNGTITNKKDWKKDKMKDEDKMKMDTLK